MKKTVGEMAHELSRRIETFKNEIDDTEPNIPVRSDIEIPYGTETDHQIDQLYDAIDELQTRLTEVKKSLE